MRKILKLNKIAREGLDLLPLDRYEIGTEITNPDGIILRSFKMHDMDLPDSLLAVGRAGSGVNNIPIEKCSERGIVVFNAPGGNANAVKELAIASLLLASRDVVKGIEYAASITGRGDEVPSLVEANKKKFAGCEIYGKTLGIIGLGKIGVMLANSAIALGMRVVGYDPFISVESAWGLSREVERAEGLDALTAKADYISLHTPLKDETRGMINEERFKNMRKGIKILNLSRGGIVNNDDLKKAIDEGIVDRYVTDFPDDEVLNMDRVIPIPHLGASTKEAEANCAVMAVKQVKDFLEKGKIKNSVNYPECKLEPTSDHRVLVMNRNIPNMVGQISGVLAEAGINITEMLNKSKGEFACTIIDVEQKPGEEILRAIFEIEGVVKVRAIAL